jgi:hypothetical protein
VIGKIGSIKEKQAFNAFVANKKMKIVNTPGYKINQIF